jgi:hypothetical protein
MNLIQELQQIHSDEKPKIVEISKATMPLFKHHIKKVLELEGEIKKMEQVGCPVIHHFAPGIYAREVTMCANAVFIGKIHKHAHLNIVSKGQVTFTDETGTRTVKAPYTFRSNAGSKKALYIHEETVWTTIHGTDETDIETIESEFVIENVEDLKWLIT